MSGHTLYTGSRAAAPGLYRPIVYVQDGSDGRMCGSKTLPVLDAKIGADFQSMAAAHVAALRILADDPFADVVVRPAGVIVSKPQATKSRAAVLANPHVQAAIADRPDLAALLPDGRTDVRLLSIGAAVVAAAAVLIGYGDAAVSAVLRIFL